MLEQAGTNVPYLLRIYNCRPRPMRDVEIFRLLPKLHINALLNEKAVKYEQGDPELLSLDESNLHHTKDKK